MSSSGYFIYAGLCVCAALVIVCAVLLCKYGAIRKKYLKFFSVLCAVCAILFVSAGTFALTFSASAPELISNANQDELLAQCIVYYTPKGSVYHFSDKCQYIVNSKNVLCGTVSDAMQNGKERACSKCSPAINIPN